MKKIAIIWGERRDHKPFETHHGFWERAAAKISNIEAPRSVHVSGWGIFKGA